MRCRCLTSRRLKFGCHLSFSRRPDITGRPTNSLFSANIFGKRDRFFGLLLVGIGKITASFLFIRSFTKFIVTFFCYLFRKRREIVVRRELNPLHLVT